MTLYLKNLNDQVSSEDLKQNLYLLFSLYGHITKLNVSKHKLRGQAFLQFGNKESEQFVFENLQNYEFLGKKIQIYEANTM